MMVSGIAPNARYFTLRAGEGLSVGPDWSLRVKSVSPVAVAVVAGQAGQELIGLARGLAISLGPARVSVAELPRGNRARVMLAVAAPQGVKLAVLKRREVVPNG